MVKNSSFHVIVLVLVIYLNFGLIESIDIVSYYPGEGIVTKEGSGLTLSCTSSVPWFFGLWHSPAGNKLCAIKETEVRGVCAEDPNISFSGSNTSYSIHLSNVTRQNHGDWMCLMNEINDFGSAKTKVKVQVGVEADVRWRGINGRNITNSEGVLQTTEGEESEIICSADRGFPQPKFSWYITKHLNQQENVRNGHISGIVERSAKYSDNDNNLPLNSTNQAIVSFSEGSSHLYSGHQSIRYRAKLEDDGLNITCIVSQTFISNGRKSEIFTSRISLQLHVTELVVLHNTVSAEEKIGIISGIIVSILFILIILIIFVLFINRRIKKKDKKYTGVGEKYKDELLTPIWNPHGKNKKRGPILGQEQLIEEHYIEDDSSRGLLSLNKSDKYSKVPNTPDYTQNSAKCHNNSLPIFVTTEAFQATSGSPTNGAIVNKVPDNSPPISPKSPNGNRSAKLRDIYAEIGTPSRPSSRGPRATSSSTGSARSSILTEKSITMRDVSDLIDSFNDIHPDNNQDKIQNVTSSDYHSITYSENDSENFPGFSCSERNIDNQSDKLLPMLHETHFGDSDSEPPTTILTPGRPTISLTPVKVPPIPSGLTIFDCELECFVPLAEYQRKVRERKIYMEMNL